MTTDKLPPHNLESEEAVLGSVLIDAEMIKVLTLVPDDFFHGVNASIYAAMLLLKDDGKGINQITVTQKLDEKSKLEDIGGAAYLSYLVSITPTSLDCLHYAEIVQRLSSSRRLIVAGENIAKMGYDADADATANLAKADKMLLDLRKTAGGSHIITPDERSRILIERYTGLYEKEKGIAISTGLFDLDRLLDGGFFGGDFLILGARPKVGKTSFAQCIANYVGQTENVLFCSAEMNLEGLSDRDVSGHIGLPVGTIRRGGFDDNIMDRILDEALPYIDSLNVYHLDFTRTPQITTSVIYQAAYEIKERHGLALLVIDYLGLLTDKYGSNENQRLGYISRTIKQMAMTMNIPIFCLHQLNRDLERRENKRPQLYDLRESGNLEQDADVILFLHRESYHNKEADNVTEVLLGGKRQGASGKGVKVLWDETHQKYCNLAREEEQSKLEG